MHATTPLLAMPPAASHARHAALFASALQPSDTPDAGMIAAAISSAVHRFGPRGCTALMAQEFGDHPRRGGPADALGPPARSLEAGAVSTRAHDSRAQWWPADPAGTLTFTEQEHTS